MDAATLPPAQQEMVTCSIEAAVMFGVPANALLAVAEQEGGRAGLWQPNANGTHDVGTMQFNTAYLRDLRRYGITVEDVAGAGCYPYRLAAWRLRRHMEDDGGDFWTRIANYHSRTAQFNQRYAGQIKRRAAKWDQFLRQHYATQDVSDAVAKGFGK
jgi:hypothetical protein